MWYFNIIPSKNNVLKYELHDNTVHLVVSLFNDEHQSNLPEKHTLIGNEFYILMRVDISVLMCYTFCVHY